MNSIQQLLTDIQTIIQAQSLSLIDKDIALQKTRKLYEEISALSTHKIVEHQIEKDRLFQEIPQNIFHHTNSYPVGEDKVEVIKINDERGSNFPIEETVKTETAKHELNTESLNDILNKNRKTELADKLEHSPIKDLKATIGFNDKFSFIQNLFAGNDAAYKMAVDQLNSFTSKAEAEQLITELSNQNKWNENEEISEHFKELINRKFL
ncbi:MAG: hypothetical protein RJA07_1895 [Bacteroidota bacterium]|jgi:hypothetical protein